MRFVIQKADLTSKLLILQSRLVIKNNIHLLPGFYANEFAENVLRRSLVQYAKDKEFKAILKTRSYFIILV